MSSLQVSSGHSKLGQQTETLLYHSLAKEYCWCQHEMWKVQKVFHDTQHHLRVHVCGALPTAEQIKRKFVTAKGNGSYASLLHLLQSGLTVAQVQRVIKDEVRENHLR